MAKPIVAMVGRPNVGKSTLFNRLAGKRISIVQDTPGVTRDRVYAEAEWLTHTFTMIDTGGIEPERNDIIVQQMRRQANIAIETADVIVFIVDGKEGLTAADHEVATMLRKSKKPVVLVVNKVDSLKEEDNAWEFYNLGIGDPITISASQGLGLGDMLDRVVENFDSSIYEQDEDEYIRIAMIGKPNVGKSSLINKLLGEDRVIVSEVAGTTRDAIDSELETEEGKFILIDTAGLRRKSKVKEEIERYSVVRTYAAIERSDVCILMIDAQEGITEQDEKIIGYAHEMRKAIMIIVNKWDLVEKDDKTTLRFTEDIYDELGFLQFAPILFASALTKQRIHRLADMLKFVSEQQYRRVSTGTLNQLLQDAQTVNPVPSRNGRIPKIYYMTQASVKPPTFILFVNEPELIHFSYMRFLENRLRESFGFEGTPIRLVLRGKKRDDED